MRLPTIVVTLLAVASVISSAAATDISKDTDALSQSTSLRGAGSDAKMHQALLSAIEADERGDFDVAGLALVRMVNCTHNICISDVPRNLHSSNLSVCFFRWSRSLHYLINMIESWDFVMEI